MGLRTTAVERDFGEEPGRVFDAFAEAVQAMPKARIDSVDPHARVIAARTGMSFTSWGENLLIKVEPSAEGRAHVTVTSTLKMQLVDWGKNKKNVEALVASATGRLERATGQQGQPPAPPPPPG